jgi:Flp pilus assembly protein TadD
MLNQEYPPDRQAHCAEAMMLAKAGQQSEAEATIQCANRVDRREKFPLVVSGV